MATNALELAARIKRVGIVAILRGDFALDDYERIAEVLMAEGLSVMEIALNNRDALTAIDQLRRRFDGTMLVGAGTVRTPEQFGRALGAGAQFLISPSFHPECAQRAAASDGLYIPGALTPTEVQNACASGCRLVKFFPADSFGPGYLKALRAPFDDVEFMPTGGVTPANLGDYVRAGAVAVAAGSTLVAAPDQPKTDLAKRARGFRLAWEEAVG